MFQSSMYIAYLDEFGHIGPYVSKSHPQFKTHPVFGFGGLLLPADRVREFGSFFQNLKCSLLAWEIARDQVHPGTWEKKGSQLLTTRNFTKYRELRVAVNRLLNRVRDMGGSVFFYGQLKPSGTPDVITETSRKRYDHALIQSISRTCNAVPDVDNLLMVLDEIDDKSRLDAMAAARGYIYGSRTGARWNDARHKMIEAPMQVESHLYPTVQAADWICALIGRITAYRLGGPEWAEFEWADRYFATRLGEVSAKGSKVHVPNDPCRAITRGTLCGTATHEVTSR